MQDPKLSAKKILRGHLLRCIHRFGSPISDTVLHESFAEYSLSKIKQALEYLADEGKGYIRLERVECEGFDCSLMATVTSRGVDLLDGSIASDPGITVPGV